MKGAGLLQGLLAAVGRAVGRRPGTVLLAMLAVTAVAAPLAARTVHPDNIEKDLLEVLTKGMPRAEAYKRIGQDFGIIDRHFVLIELDDPADLPRARKFADLLAGKLAGDRDLVRSVRSRVDFGKLLRDFFGKYAHVYLDEETAGRLRERMADRAMAKAMERNRELVRTAGLQIRQRVLSDPLNVVEILRGVARRRSGGSLPFGPEGYILSPEMPGLKRTLMVDVRPTQPAAKGEEEGFTHRLMAHTRAAIAEARAEFLAADPELGSRVHTSIGGAYAAMQEAGRLFISGVLRSALTSFVGILLLFALAYRRPAAFLFIGVPLAVPVLWTLAAAPPFLFLLGYEGRLSIIGGAFAAVLLGLGVDYAIHLYNRFTAERAAGRSPEEATEVSISATGEGIVLGALTTVTAFLGMTWTKFRGFREFGVLAALGVFLTMIALLLGLPAMLTLISRWRGGRERAGASFSFGLARVCRMVRAGPGAFVFVGLLWLGGSVAAMFTDPAQPGVNFESDMAAMGPSRKIDKVGEVNRRARRAFGLDYREVSVIASGRSAEEVLERTAEFHRRARACGKVRSLRGIGDRIPAPSAQRRSIQLVRALQFEEVPERLERAAVAAGFGPGALRDCKFSKFVRKMAERAREGAELDVEAFLKSEDESLAALRELVACAFRPPGGDCAEYRTHTLLSLGGGRMEEKDYAGLAGELGIDGEKLRMTSYILVAYELKASVRGDLIMVTMIVAGFVLVMLLLALRRPVYVLLALSPVVLGGAYMLVIMKIAGVDLNYINVLVFPVLIGIGVDNAVHLIIRYRQEGLDISRAVTQTGRALVLCSLTTMFGFLSLVTCPHWGLQSLGITVAIGMGFVLLVSVFFVPAALELLSRRAAPRRGG